MAYRRASMSITRIFGALTLLASLVWPRLAAAQITAVGSSLELGGIRLESDVSVDALLLPSDSDGVSFVVAEDRSQPAAMAQIVVSGLMASTMYYVDRDHGVEPVFEMVETSLAGELVLSEALSVRHTVLILAKPSTIVVRDAACPTSPAPWTCEWAPSGALVKATAPPDCTIDEPVQVDDGGVVLDFNGCTMASVSAWAVWIKADGVTTKNLTVTDPAAGCVLCNGYGDVTIEGLDCLRPSSSGVTLNYNSGATGATATSEAPGTCLTARSPPSSTSGRSTSGPTARSTPSCTTTRLCWE
jgi:hypothetical protein